MGMLLLQVYRTLQPQLKAIHRNTNRHSVTLLHGNITVVQNRGCSSCPKNTFPPRAPVSQNSSACPEVWLIFAGLGSQWTGMCESLMQLGAFADSIRRSREILNGVGVDLDWIFEQHNKAMFENIRAASVSTGVIIVALVDCLKAFKIQPRGLIGYSCGELAAGYADGCLTAEQAVLMYEACGRALEECVIGGAVKRGGMASVGMSWNEARPKCTEGIHLACNNAACNVTISRAADQIEDFMETLEDEDIFVAPIDSCDLALHSPLVNPAYSVMIGYYSKIIGENGTKPRSKRWVPTSFQINDDVSLETKASHSYNATPEFFANNVRNPVYFYEALQCIPPNSIVLEVGPTKALSTIIAPSVHPSCKVLPLMDQAAIDGVGHFLNTMKTLRKLGVNVDYAT